MWQRARGKSKEPDKISLKSSHPMSALFRWKSRHFSHRMTKLSLQRSQMKPEHVLMHEIMCSPIVVHLADATRVSVSFWQLCGGRGPLVDPGSRTRTQRNACPGHRAGNFHLTAQVKVYMCSICCVTSAVMCGKQCLSYAVHARCLPEFTCKTVCLTWEYAGGLPVDDRAEFLCVLLH